MLQASSELIREDGYMDSSINKINERSGVSPGSLYQYFPNREAIFLVLYEDVSSKIAKAMKATMMRYSNADISEGVEGIFSALLELQEQHQLIVLRFIEEMPALRVEVISVSFRNFIHSSVRSYLQ